MFIDDESLPTKKGIKPLTQCFIQGLAGTIRLADEKGWVAQADLLSYVIAELKRSLASGGGQLEKGTF